MRVFIFFFVFLLSGLVNAQNNDADITIDPETLQRVFNQISIPESEIPVQGSKGGMSACDFFILKNDFITEHEKYFIDGHSICAVDKGVIFQLNQDFFEIESVEKLLSKIHVKIIFYRNNGVVIQEWLIKEKVK